VTQYRRNLWKIILVLGLSLILMEALLHTVPIPDPTGSLKTKRFHRFLPGWNLYNGWFAKEPPLTTTVTTGPLIGVSTRRVVINVNRFGFLYSEDKFIRKSIQELRIGVVGGSTVECGALEQGKRWPDVLERLLSKDIPDREVTVLNMGLSGQDTRTHLATVAQHAVKLDLDYLVFMVGANDLFRADSSDPFDNQFYAFLSIDCNCRNHILMKSQLIRRLLVLNNRFVGNDFYDEMQGEGRSYFSTRALEKFSLPVLSTAKKEISAAELDDYEKNIVSLSALAVAHKIIPIFTTQPMLWKPIMNSDEEAVDWLVGTVVSEGRLYRLHSSEQARLLEVLNRQLLKTCSKQNLKCIDLEKSIPRSLQYFYDPLHFNEAGAEAVAHHVAQGILNEIKNLPSFYTR
jgi:lysophospholipase L1-like esterase